MSLYLHEKGILYAEGSYADQLMEGERAFQGWSVHLSLKFRRRGLGIEWLCWALHHLLDWTMGSRYNATKRLGLTSEKKGTPGKPH